MSGWTGHVVLHYPVRVEGRWRQRARVWWWTGGRRGGFAVTGTRAFVRNVLARLDARTT